MQIKTVDTKEYINSLRAILAEGKKVPLTVVGGSMLPFLASGRDRVLITPIFEIKKRGTKPLRRGDIVLFQRKNGEYVLHRICKVKKEGYYLVGDAQTTVEGPICREQIFGKIEKVQRKGNWMEPGNIYWKFYRYLWIRMIPFRPVFLWMRRKIWSAITILFEWRGRDFYKKGRKQL